MSKREKWPLSRKLSAVLAAALLSVVANGTALWWSSSSSARARAENCDRTRDALDVFTDALGVATSAEEVTVEAFRADWHEALDGCS